jgi:hypothetical protein
MAGEVRPDPSGSPYGVVTGFVRTGAGQPLGHCGLLPYPVSPLAASLKEKLYLTNSDGSYRLPLPAGAYTIRVQPDSPSGGSLFGEVTGVVVTAGQETQADIVVTEQDGPSPSQPESR